MNDVLTVEWCVAKSVQELEMSVSEGSVSQADRRVARAAVYAELAKVVQREDNG